MALQLRTPRILGFLVCLFLLAPLASYAAGTGATCDISHPCPSGQTCQLSASGGATCVSAATAPPKADQGAPTDKNSVQSASTDKSASSHTDACGNQEGVLHNPLKFCSLSDFLHAILQAVVELGSILLIFMLVWVGFLFVMAQGNPEKISSARTALIWVLIGGMILLGAEAISLVIAATVNSLTV